MAEITADAGIVRIQTHTILLATNHRTADKRRVTPTPTIAPAIVCVVLTGMPRWAVRKSAEAAAVSALNPPKGESFVIFIPIVRMILQPPKYVPKAIAAWAKRIT